MTKYKYEDMVVIHKRFIKLMLDFEKKRGGYTRNN